ncbi:unnamed protein product [Orchesella dallaii]|uniref:Uncharacterized protein n=1 Tax=Orchesella dallaii TaxID=48710 RepID=A0ABP1PNR3_9HEXA
MSGDCMSDSNFRGVTGKITLKESKMNMKVTNTDVKEFPLIEELKSRVNSLIGITDTPSIDDIKESHKVIINRLSFIDTDKQEEVLQFIHQIAETVNDEKSTADNFLRLAKELFLSNFSVCCGSLRESESANILERFNEGMKCWNVFKRNHQSFAKELEEYNHQLMLKVHSTLCDLDRNHPQLLVKLNPFFEKLLENWSSPLKWELKPQEGTEKHILVLRKPVILMSKEISIVEEILCNASVEEVHFVASEVFYVDHTLNNTEWHGKNILVVSKKVECILPNATWDLTGIDGLNAPTARANDGTDEDPNGSDGVDGTPGGKGGSVIFLADEYVRLHLLSIESHGGNGGNGQPGGNGRSGKDGVDGRDIPLQCLKNEFGSPVREANEGIGECINTIVNLRKQLVEIESCRAYNLDETNAFPLFAPPLTSRSYYLKGITKDGVHVEFGYYSKKLPFYFTRYAYCLIKGALGTPGTPGGMGGLGGTGGPGGNAGCFGAYCLNGSRHELEASEAPVLLAENGKSGECGFAGTDGEDGQNGRNGKDVGYVDSLLWDEPDYFPPGSYDLISNDIEEDRSVWCSFFNKWRHIEPMERVQTPIKIEKSCFSSVKRRVKRGRQKIDCISMQCAMEYVHEVEYCDISSVLNELWPENADK